MKRMVFKTLLRLTCGALVEGMLSGEADPDTGSVSFQEFRPQSAETQDGEEINLSQFSRIMHAIDFDFDESNAVDKALLEHAVEDKDAEGLQHYRVPLGDRLVDVYCHKVTLGSRGYFDHRTGAAESPSGPEVDVALIRDAETDETIPVDGVEEAAFNDLVIAVAEAVMEKEAAEVEASMPSDDAD